MDRRQESWYRYVYQFALKSFVFFRTLSSAGAANNEEVIAKVAADTGAPTM